MPSIISLTSTAEDFPLEPVPATFSIPWGPLTVMRLGQFATLAQLFMGATLGFNMGIIPAFIGLAVGTVILLLIATPMGIIGCQTRQATALITRRVGLGVVGSGVFSVVAGLSVMGWFAVQTSLFASGLKAFAGAGAGWLWTMVAGLTVTVMVYGGILAMRWIANITMPLFVVMLGIGLSRVITRGVTLHLLHGPSGHILTVSEAITLVVGSFVTGAVVSPDMTRFQRSNQEVIKQTLVSFLVGNGLIAGVGILLGQMLRTTNVTGSLIGALPGLAGLLLFVTSTIKVSDWDIYGSSLALVNGLDLLGVRGVGRKRMTLVVGIMGTLLAMAGMVNSFEPFLIVLGVAIPPVAVIVIVDWVLGGRSADASLLRGADKGNHPLSLTVWALVAWLAGFAVGRWLPWGIGTVNSLLAAGVIYGLGRLIQHQRRLPLAS